MRCLTSIRATGLPLRCRGPGRPRRPRRGHAASSLRNFRRSEFQHMYHLPKSFFWLGHWHIFAVTGFPLSEGGGVVSDSDLSGKGNTLGSTLRDLSRADVAPQPLMVLRETCSRMLSPSKRALGLGQRLLKIFNGTLKHKIYPRLLESGL